MTNSIPVFSQAHKDFFMIMRNTGEYTLWDQTKIKTYGFAETIVTHPLIPGPTIEVNEGDTVSVGAMNFSQGAPHTIHLHGLDVDQANDGVPHLSFTIEHMDSGYYQFIATHAGNYLYHCHVSSVLHVQMGMYGKIIVNAKDGTNNAWTGGPGYDKDYDWMTSEFDTIWHTDSVLDNDIGHFDSTGTHEVKIPEYAPQYFMVNGKSQHQLYEDDVFLKGKQNESIYLRLFNIGYLYNRYIFPAHLEAEILSSDGRPLPQSEQSDTLYVFPGERYGVMIKPSIQDSGHIQLDYLDMNNSNIAHSEFIPFDISGFASSQLIKKNNFKAYPNPTNDQIFISTNIHGAKPIIEVFDVTGKRLLTSHKSTISLKNYKKGTYLLKFIYDDITEEISIIKD